MQRAVRAPGVGRLTPILCAWLGIAGGGRGAQEPPPPDRFEREIAAFEAADRADPPAPGGVVFAGSSTIRLWDLADSFPGVVPLNRGFGGSQMADLVRYAPRIILPYRPRTIVVYSGDNDIQAGKTPEAVAADFGALLGLIRVELPRARVVCLGIKPSPARWDLYDRMRAANALIDAACRADGRAELIDLGPELLGPDGRPRPEFYAADRLHLSPAGYRAWTDRLRPELAPDDPGPAPAGTRTCPRLVVDEREARRGGARRGEGPRRGSVATTTGARFPRRGSRWSRNHSPGRWSPAAS